MPRLLDQDESLTSLEELSLASNGIARAMSAISVVIEHALAANPDANLIYVIAGPGKTFHVVTGDAGGGRLPSV